MTVPNTVAALVSAQRLQRVPVDPTTARARLARADDKLAAARKIASIDVEIAYVTAYAAARIAVTAHMLSVGYRVRAMSGAHEAVGIYAEAMVTAPRPSSSNACGRRNKAEYDDIVVGQADLAADLVHAQAIVDAVRRAV